MQKARAIIAENVRKASMSTTSSSESGITTNGFINPKTGVSGDETYAYFKFDPSQVTTEQVQAMEADTAMMLMQIPMGNGALYNDDLSLNEAMAEQLKDGNVYGVTSTNDPILATIMGRTYSHGNWMCW